MDNEKPILELKLEAVSILITKDGDYVMTDKSGDKVTLTSKTVGNIIKFGRSGGAIGKEYKL